MSNVKEVASLTVYSSYFMSLNLLEHYSDKLGKELGNCTHQWKTNDDTNIQALSTLSLLQVKEERQKNNRRKKEAEKRTDEKEATKL